MAVTVKFSGGKDLERALKGLGSHISARGVGRRVLKAAGKPVADAANSMAPDDPNTTGGLNTSYVVTNKLNAAQKKQVGRNKKGNVPMYIGTNDPAGIQQEFGNANHAPQPHFRPAWESGKAGVLNHIKNTMGDEVIKTAKRLAVRRAKKAK